MSFPLALIHHFGEESVVIRARADDSRHVTVWWNKINSDDALDPSRYEVDNGLQVVSVRRVTSIEYQLTTSQQTLGITYTIVASGIRDVNGNIA